jgi:sulfonate transport system substrate-binding protein
MKKIVISIAIIVALVGIGIASALYINRQQTPTEQTDLRLGWQTAFATQGQLTQVLAHTDIPKENGLNISYKGFDSGAPLNEAALGGQVDALFTADQPAATLISKDSDWVIIGRLMYNRVSVYVPPASPIKTIADLKDKTVAVPFGTASQKALLQQEQKAGLTPGTDVKNINLGIYEQSDLVKDAKATKWGEIDAMAGFDPTPAIFQEKGLIRLIATDQVVSTIVMSKEYIDNNPNAPKQFLKAFKESYEYYRANVTQANTWFKEGAKLNVSDTALATSAAVEPNLKSGAEIRLSFNDDDYKRMQATVDFLIKQGIIKAPLTIKDHINLTYLPE